MKRLLLACALAALAVPLFSCFGTVSDDWPRAADLTVLAATARVAPLPGEAPSDRPPLVVTDDGFALAAGHRMELFLEIPSPAVLRIGRMAARGELEGTVLRVSAQWEGDRLRPLMGLPPRDAPLEVQLDGGPGPEPTPIRLVLETLGGADAVLFSPEIRTPKGPPPEVSGTSSASSEVSGTPEAETRQAPGPAASDAPPNLLIYLVDTLRADRLGLYGYDRPTSPRLDGFAERPGSVTFDDMVAVSSWTRPTVATLLSGFAPDVHGVHGRRDRLADEVDTLAEILQRSGYRTAARVANSNVIGRFGFAQGFDDFQWLRTQSPNHRSPGLGRLALGWLDGLTARQDDAPFFLYVHTADPHSPYQPPADERSRFAPDVPRDLAPPVGTRPWLRGLDNDPDRPTAEEIAWLSDLYDGEVAANDRSFGALLDGLAARGLDRDTVVVFVSDHGEELGEHGGLEHGRTLHGEQLHVPFVVHLPGRQTPSRRIAAQVDQLDFLPTVLAALGIDGPPGLPGRNLLSASSPPTPDDDRHRTFSWLDLEEHHQTSLTEPRFKLLVPETGPPLLYDRRQDPAETRDLAADRPVRSGLLETALAWRRLHPEATALDGGEAELDAETIRELEALGYLR